MAGLASGLGLGSGAGFRCPSGVWVESGFQCLSSMFVIGVRSWVRLPVWGRIHFRSAVGSGVWCLSSVSGSGPVSGLGSDPLPVQGRVQLPVSVIGARHRCLGRVQFPVWGQIHFCPRSGQVSGVCHRCSSSVSGSGTASGPGSGPPSGPGSGAASRVCHRCLSSVFVIGVRGRVHLLVRDQVRRPVRVGPAPAPGGHRGRAGLWVQDRRHRTLSASGR